MSKNTIQRPMPCQGKTPEQHEADRKAAKARKAAQAHKRQSGAPRGSTKKGSLLVTDPSRLRPSFAEVQATVFDKLDEAIIKVANNSTPKWSDEEREQAIAYARKLVFGENRIATKSMNRMVRRMVEQRFATTCWLQRRTLGNTKLPGMGYSFYVADYAAAQRQFPAREAPVRAFAA